jgi:hypothetical protein
MSEFLEHPFHVCLLERFEQFGMLVRFLEAQFQFRADFGAGVAGLAHQFVAMFVEPAGEPPALFRRQGLDGGFQLFHAHAVNLQSPAPIANQKSSALVAQVLQKIFDERLHF